MNTGSFYLAVGNRCAVNMESLSLPIPDSEAVMILQEMGFQLINESLTSLLEPLVGQSIYKRNCQAEEAPAFVDCSSLAKWVFGKKGIWLPRHPIDQRYIGFPEVQWQIDSLGEGDLLFTTGSRNRYWDDPALGVGHVGMVTNRQTVIHAANSNVGVVEVSLQDILSRWKNRGVVRVIPNDRTYTFECEPEYKVEYSAAFRWKILSTLT